MSKKQAFYGRSALITGGSSGIGLSLAKILADEGASVTLLARDPDKLARALNEINQLRSQKLQLFSTIQADVSDYPGLQASLTEWVNENGSPDLIFNAAGVARPGYVEELDVDIYKWTMDVDYHGTVNVIKILLPGMLLKGSGHIINFSSIAGVIGLFGYTAYNGAKFAVKGFSDALRMELKPKGINVSVVFPPDTDTPQLAWENQFKPYETKYISGTATPISPDFVAEKILKKVKQNKYAILPGWEAKLMYLAGTRLGGWIYPILDSMVLTAAKKKNSDKP